MWVFGMPTFPIIVLLCTTVLGQSDVRLPPSMVISPSKEPVIYRSEDMVTLECKGKGVPDVTYEWKKNGFELNQNLNNIHKGADGTITIYPATSMDEGFYQCFVKNQYGTALSNMTHIQRALLDSSAGTPSTLQKTIGEGQPLVIQADPRKSFPKPTYGWEMATNTTDKNPIRLRPSKRIQIADNGDLHFAYAMPEDALDGKIYKCTTYNPYLDVKAGGIYAKLTVTRSPSGVTQFAPTIGFSSETQTVAVIGGSATLRCFFYGNPEPTITWTGPRNTLPIGRYTLGAFNTELTILNITAGDEGDYICIASNTQGRKSHTLQIRVEEVPVLHTVRDGPYDVNVTEGESITFSCNVNSKPGATIVWLQDGAALDVDNLPRRFAFSTNGKSLTIKDICRNCDDRLEKQTDLTVIQCNASNIHGYAFASGYLNVLSRTKVILVDSPDVSVGMYENKEVRFECGATSDPSTPPSLRWYKVESDGDQPVQENPPTVTIKDGVLTISVNPNGTQKWETYAGEYRCIGDNGYSKASASVKLIVEDSVHEDNEEEGFQGYWVLLICIGILVFLLLLSGILYVVIKRKRNTRPKRSSIARQASREREALGPEPSCPLYETIADVHDYANEAERTEMERRRGQFGNSPVKHQQSRSDYMALDKRNPSAPPTYASLQLTFDNHGR